MSDPKPPFSLTPSEWLVIFPRVPGTTKGPAYHFPTSLSELSDDVEAGSASPAVFDPASELRKQFPVDRKVLDDTLGELGAKGLEFQNRCTDWFGLLVQSPKAGIIPIIVSVLWALSTVAMI
jgi:hypothetical protein